MQIDNTPDDVTQGEDVMSGMAVIDSEEELQRYLKGNQGAKPEAETPETPKPEAKKPAETKKPVSPFAAPDAEEEEEEPGEEKEKKPVTEAPQGTGDDGEVPEFPSVVHYLNDRHKLGLNLQGFDSMTKEQEAEALDSVIEKMTEGVNTALEEYQYIETLLQDAEIQQVLRAKQEGKSLRDVFAQFSSSPEGLNDDALALQDFKKKFPKSPEEAIQGMVESLKKNGQFEAVVRSLREQHVEEQSLESARAEQEAKRKAEEDAARDAEDVQRYAQYLSGLPAVYGIPLTQDMKENVFEMTTARDKKGLTPLDYALQSDEGTVLAALGVLYMKKLIQDGSSIQKNRAKGKMMDRIFETPDKLQSSGGRGAQEDQYSPDLLQKF